MIVQCAKETAASKQQLKLIARLIGGYSDLMNHEVSAFLLFRTRQQGITEEK
jgi:hypothetical protein